MDHPETVVVGDVFAVKVEVKNTSSKKLRLANLDLYDGLLDGFEVVTVFPKPPSEERIFGYQSYNFEKDIKSGETFTVKITLRAETDGYWGGEIDACTPMQSFISHYTEIVVDPVGAPTSGTGGEAEEVSD